MQGTRIVTQPELSQPDRAPSAGPGRPYPYGTVPETVQPYGAAPDANPSVGYPAAPPAGYGYGSPLVMRPTVNVGAAWRWAWAQLKSQPLLLTPMPLWIAVGFAVGFTSINVIDEMPDVDDEWGVVFVPVTFLLFGVGLLVQTRASLVVASGQRLLVRHLFTLPNPVRSVVVFYLCGILQLVGGITGILGVVAAYFFLFATRGALARRLGVFKAIGRSCTLMGSGSAITLALAVWGLSILSLFTIIGWIVLWPVADLMITYAYVQLAGPPDASPAPSTDR